MGIQIFFDSMDGDLTNLIKEVDDRLSNFTPLLIKYQVLMVRSFSMNFKSQGRPRRWAKLSPTTIANRRKRSSRILQNTRQLELSVTTRRAKGNVTRFSPNSLRMGTSLKHAEPLQEGTKPYIIRPKRKKFLSFLAADGQRVFTKEVRHPGLTPRPFVIIQREDVNLMEELAEDYASGEGRF